MRSFSPPPPPGSLLQSWPGAMNVAERLHLLEAAAAGNPGELGTGRSRAAAQIRLKQWREVSGFASEDRFKARLSLFGLQDPAQLEELLGVDPVVLADDTPGWVTDMLSAYEVGPQVREYAEPAPPLAQDEPLLLWQRQLNALAEPIFAGKINEHGTGVLQDADARGRRPDVELILAARPRSMFRYLAGIFVLRMHIAELRNPGARDFDRHVKEFITTENFSSMLARYPVAARVLCEVADRWVRAEVLLARRYLADLDQLAALCGVRPEQFRLASVSPCLGDPHNGYQTVHALTSSTGLRVIYKPTDCRIFERLSHLLDWIHGEDPDLGYRIPAALVGDGYGWIEYVERSSCASEAEFPAFYIRMGSMIAISWLLASTDMHPDNMIACGDQPTLLDLETVIGCSAAAIPAPVVAGQDDLFRAMMKSSVMNCGILPSFTVLDGENPVDLTALGAREGQHVALDAWNDGGTTNMRRERIEGEYPVIACAPYLAGGRQACAEEFAEEIESGFRQTCQLFVGQREYLLSGRSPLAGFRECRQRILFKNTSFYARLGLHLNHPDLLIEAVDRDRYLDNIFASGSGEREFASICQAERAAVDRSDIPHFTVDCGSRALLADNSTLAEDYFQSSPWDALRSRLSAVSPEEVNRQAWYLRMSLESLRLNRSNDPADIDITCCSDLPEQPAPDAVVRAAVRLLADKVVALRFDGGSDGLCWPTVQSTKGVDRRVTVAGNNLYAGNMGIALFLAHAARYLGDPCLESLARRSLEPVIREILAADPGPAPRIGAHTGLAGYLYGLTCLSRIWGEDYSGLQQKLVRDIRDMAPEDPFVDVLSGSAGAGLVLAACLPYLPDGELVRDAARACADRILAASTHVADGMALPVAKDTPPLTGFAHGAAGYSLALLRLGSLFADSALAGLSAEARGFEALHFSPSQGGWADLRPDVYHPGRPSWSWCNGAAGIGLSRCLAVLSAGEDLPDATRTMDDIRHALRASRAQGIGNSQCLCHGDLGAAEFHRSASQLDGLADEADYAQRIAGMVAREVLAGRPVCGMAPGVSAPGLMTGHAGIGFGLLRSLDSSIPNVLAVAV